MIIKHKQTETFMWDDDKKFPRTVTINVIKISALDDCLTLPQAVEDYETHDILGVSEAEYKEAKAFLDTEQDNLQFP